MTHTGNDDLDHAVVPPPRRSDDAFARAVAADIDAVKGARTRWPWLALGPLAATAAAVAFTVVTPNGADVPATPTAVAVTDRANDADTVDGDDGEDGDDGDDDVNAADLGSALDDVDDRTLLALAGDAPEGDDEITGDDFSFSGVLGSSDQELAAVEAALDTALRRL